MVTSSRDGSRSIHSTAPARLTLEARTGDRACLNFASISMAVLVKYRHVPGSIGVLEAPDNPMPIGMASCRTWDENGLAVWTPRIGGQEIAGRWVIIDRQFKPMQ